MSDGKVEYIVQTRFEGEGDLRQAVVAIERVGSEAERATARANQSASRQSFGWTELKSQIDLAAKALQQVGQVAGQAWDALNEGAAQLRQEEIFANLAESIGTTADALETKLGAATKGLVDDASLIKGASDLISLGLADNEDMAVRLSSVIGALGWDMQVLTLTLANNSVLRLDALGLAMEDVKARAAALKEEGLGVDEAFDLAVIEAGEAKMRLLGDASASTAGKLQQLQVIALNVANTLKSEFARGVGEGLGEMTGQADLLGEAIEKAGGRWAYAFGSGAGTVASVAAVAGGIEALKSELAGLGGPSADFVAYIQELSDSLDFGENMADPQRLEANLRIYEAIRNEVNRLAQEEERRRRMQQANPETGRNRYVGPTPTRDFGTPAPRPLPPDLASGYWQYSEALGAVNEELLAQSKAAIMARDAWGAYASEMTSYGGDIFSGFLGEARAAREEGEAFAYDLADAMITAVDGIGAGVGPLADIAVELGLIDEATAAVLENATAQQIIAENLAGAANSGKIAWEEYVTAVERAIAVYEGKEYLIDLGPREMPEPEERGYRRGDFQETGVEDTREKASWAVVLEADNQAVLDAVAEAQGVVEGFISPQDAYLAVMDLDIQAVIDGSNEATRLINGIPSHKVITIAWEQSGADVMAALRALGVIR